MIKLSRLETVSNVIIWSFGVAYSLYNLYLVGNEFNHSEHNKYHYDDFTPGWFGRFQDTSDFEWKCWTRLWIYLLPWLIVNSVGGRMLRASFKLRNIVTLWYSAITLLAVSHVLTSSAACLFFFIVLTFHYITFIKNPICVWLLGWLWRRYTPAEILGKTEEDIYLIEVASSWLVLRCFAYSFESMRNPRQSFPVILSYGLYLPTMFCGPFLVFTSFHQNLIASPPVLTSKKLLHILRLFVRCIFWYMFTMFALHFIYVNAILLRPYIVAGMTTWQLAGLGIGMGHFFHLKYIVFYGLASCWAALEGYKMPSPPCCVSRVYLYSAMWRNFDTGLYQFLVRYIYVPVIKCFKFPTLMARTFASVMCFFFVFVWHGEEEYVLYWVILNFTAITIEALVKTFCNLPRVQKKIDLYLSASNQRRLHCLLASPLHYFSMISNYFFIGSLDIGKIYFNRAIRESDLTNLYIIFFLYGAAQTTVSIETWEREKIKL